MNALHACGNSFRLLQLRGPLMVAAHRNQGAIHQPQYAEAA
jgi:hypothetical protein